jgi:initiation factor 1A
MVKNTTGGTGTKSLARKNETRGNNSRLRLIVDELEKYACVTKIFGNGMVEIYTNNNEKLVGHIRNKFRGKQKRHNMISLFSIVLVGLREWEKPSKNCDILCIYDENQIEQLKHIPNVNIEHILQLRTTGSFSKHADTEIEFSMQEEDEPIKKGGDETEFILEKIQDIDIDDI